MVAGGVGLAPFWTLAEALVKRGVRTTLFYGARRGEELFYLDYFRQLGVSLVLTTEDGSVGEQGRVIAPLERALASRAASDDVILYACGPEGMLEATAHTAAKFDRRCEVSVERIMGCGMGGCYSCIVPMKDGNGGFHHVRSCIAGPVLDAAEGRQVHHAGVLDAVPEAATGRHHGVLEGERADSNRQIHGRRLCHARSPIAIVCHLVHSIWAASSTGPAIHERTW